MEKREIDCKAFSSGTLFISEEHYLRCKLQAAGPSRKSRDEGLNILADKGLANDTATTQRLRNLRWDSHLWAMIVNWNTMETGAGLIMRGDKGFGESIANSE